MSAELVLMTHCYRSSSSPASHSSPPPRLLSSSQWIPALCCSCEVAFPAPRCSSAPPLLSWFHRLCPSPSFQQLLWAPGSCQKSSSSQSPTGASQWRPGKKTAHDVEQPMPDAHNCTLPGGKVHSESMNVSIFNLSGRKRGAKQPLLKQSLIITQSMRVWLLDAGKQKHALHRQV